MINAYTQHQVTPNSQPTKQLPSPAFINHHQYQLLLSLTKSETHFLYQTEKAK